MDCNVIGALVFNEEQYIVLCYHCTIPGYLYIGGVVNTTTYNPNMASDIYMHHPVCGI